jgi:hypothetical protein
VVQFLSFSTVSANSGHSQMDGRTGQVDSNSTFRPLAAPSAVGSIALDQGDVSRDNCAILINV